MQAAKPIRNQRSREQGYILLAVMLLITLMLIALSVELPRISQQIQRGKEQELVNRGMEYAKAIKKYRRKMGTFPTSVEQLENTNHIRFLRKRYKDPFTGETDWKMIHPGEAQIPMPQGNNPGLPGSGNPGIQGATFTNTPNTPTGQAGLNTSGGLSGGGTGLSGGGGLSGSTGLSGGGLSGGGTGLSGSTGLSGGTGLTGGTGQAGNQQGQVGSLATSNIGNGQTFGGGGIIGVASTSKKSGIKEFNDHNEYDQWYFVYDPRLEQAAGVTGGGNAGIIVAAPSGKGPAGSGGASGAGQQGQQPGQNPPQPTGTPPPNPQ